MPQPFPPSTKKQTSALLQKTSSWTAQPLPRWLEIAQDEVGQKALSAQKNNSRIVEYHAKTLAKATDDETPWGSSFINWCMDQAGYKGTMSAQASSWVQWGTPCQARLGAITVIYNASLTKGSPKLSGNQVGFLLEETATHYTLLGGDQGGKLGQVKVSSFPKSKWKLRAYRWPTASPTAAPRQPPSPAPVVRPRTVTPDETALLARLDRLGAIAKTEGKDGAEFQVVVNELRKTLHSRLSDLQQGQALPADVNVVMKALHLWSQDTGGQWGEGRWDSKELKLSAPDYATVPASQYKCNAYVSEALYQSLGKVFLVHASKEEKGKYFPYQAREWGNAAVAIPNFKVVAGPAMGDIWSNGTHTGIYLGTHNGQRLYISARDDGNGVFGEDQVQHTHGIQIKYLPDGGVYRRYTP